MKDQENKKEKIRAIYYKFDIIYTSLEALLENIFSHVSSMYCILPYNFLLSFKTSEQRCFTEVSGCYIFDNL